MLKAKIDEAEEEMDRCDRIQLATCCLLERWHDTHAACSLKKLLKQARKRAREAEEVCPLLAPLRRPRCQGV